MYFENYLDLKFSNFNLFLKNLNLLTISSLEYKFLAQKKEMKSFSNVLWLEASSRHVTRLPYFISEKVLRNISLCLVCNLKIFLMDQGNFCREQK